MVILYEEHIVQPPVGVKITTCVYIACLSTLQCFNTESRLSISSAAKPLLIHYINDSRVGH